MTSANPTAPDRVRLNYICMLNKPPSSLAPESKAPPVSYLSKMAAEGGALQKVGAPQKVGALQGLE